METIKSSADITRVFKLGQRFGRGSNMLLILKDDEQHGPTGRVAFVAGKKLGNAVWRNKAKRRMRAACQQLHVEWPGYDVIFVAGKYTADIDFPKLVDGYRRLLEQANLKAE